MNETNPKFEKELINISLRLSQRFYKISEIKEVFYDFKNFVDFYNLEDYDSFGKWFNIVEKLISLENNEEKTFISALQFILSMEFDGNTELSDYFEDSCIIFEGKNECIFEIGIENKEKSTIITNENFLKCLGNVEVNYLETPYILEFGHMTSYMPGLLRKNNFHQELLIKKIKKSDKTNIQMNYINDLVNELVGGEFYFNQKKLQFEYKINEKVSSIKNIAMGFKQIGIIQLLMNVGALKNSFMIMDEPEIHLHPELQLKLANIIVLLSKEFNVQFFISSHSSQFIESIEVYSKYYGIEKEVNFYLSEFDKKSNKYNFQNVENKYLKTLYRDLGSAYNTLDKLRAKNLSNDF